MFWRIAIIWGLFISADVNAALIDNGKITTDTRSGLDWLDLTETTGLTRNYIQSQMSSGGIYEGWGYADIEQIQGLYESAGGYSSDAFTVDNANAAGILLDLWGITNSSVSSQAAEFVSLDFGMEYLGTYIPVDFLLYGAIMTAGDQGYLYVHQSYFAADDSHPNIGHALVRVSTVPLPAAAWLFCSGLLGLVSLARQMVKKTNLVDSI